MIARKALNNNYKNCKIDYANTQKYQKGYLESLRNEIILLTFGIGAQRRKKSQETVSSTSGISDG